MEDSEEGGVSRRSYALYTVDRVSWIKFIAHGATLTFGPRLECL